MWSSGTLNEENAQLCACVWVMDEREQEMN